MHVPDGIVPLWLQILLMIVSATMMIISYRKVKTRFNEKLVPFMGVLAAVIFAAQLVNFPVPPFSSGHLVGSTLLAVMVNPWVALLIMALVLFVQALYGDGGILTYGLNLFNMGVFSVFLGYGLALVLFKTTKRFISKEKATLLSAGVASFVVTVSAAFVLGLELLTVGGFGLEALVALTGVHVIIGFGEAILTVAILLYFVKANPDLVVFLRSEKTKEDDTARAEEEESPPTQSSITRNVIPILVASIIVVSLVIVAGLASSNPDGFEWALFEYAGVPEPEPAFEGIWSFLGEGSMVDLVTGSVGIIAALGLGFIIFRRATHNSHDHKHTDKFLLPFDDGRSSSRAFSPTGMIISSIILAVLISLQTVVSIVLAIIMLILVGGWIGGTGWKRVFSLAAKFEVIILFWIFFEPFLYGSTVIFSFNLFGFQINAYSEGLYLGLLLGTRMFAILLTFLATLSHMTLNDFVGALRTLRVPSAILGALLIMFRYVPLFMEERTRMQEAQVLRGSSRGTRFERIKSLGFMIGTTINRSFDRSVTAYEAMSLRGFGKGTMVSGAGFKRTDLLLPLFILALFASVPFFVPILLEVFLI